MSGWMIHLLPTFYMPLIYLLSGVTEETSGRPNWERLTRLAPRLASLEGARDDCEDVAQEALLRLLQHPIDDGVIKVEAFLGAVVRGLVAVQKRSENRRSRREGEFAQRYCRPFTRPVVDGEARLLCRSLSASDRRLAELLMEGWTVREIASRLQLTRWATHRQIITLRKRPAA